MTGPKKVTLDKLHNYSSLSNIYSEYCEKLISKISIIWFDPSLKEIWEDICKQYLGPFEGHRISWNDGRIRVVSDNFNYFRR